MKRFDRQASYSANITRHQSAAEAQNSLGNRNREADRKKQLWEYQLEILRRRLEENEKDTEIQTEIRKAIQGEPRVETEMNGALRGGPSTAVTLAEHTDQEECNCRPHVDIKGFGPHYVHFPHAAQIVPDRPDVSPFGALIYEGMFLEVYEDGTFTLNCVVETPNTDVVMRLQFVVFIMNPQGEYVAEPQPRTITLPPIKFPRQRDGKEREERVFWTVGQTGFSSYLTPAVRNAAPQVLVRRAEAEFGSVPDRPAY